MRTSISTVSILGSRQDDSQVLLPGSEPENDDQNGILSSETTNVDANNDYANASFWSGFGPYAMDLSLGDLDWDTVFPSSDWTDNFSYPLAVTAGSDIMEPNQPLQNTDRRYVDGLQIQQIDSVEGKCVEIRSLLQGFHTGIHLDSMLEYITRDRLVECIHLYSKYYQSAQPILHLPTFELNKTSPSLLLAMMLVGACYSSSGIPARIIVQCAIHALHVIEGSTVCTCRLVIKDSSTDQDHH